MFTKSQVASSIPFDSSISEELISENVEEAIVELEIGVSGNIFAGIEMIEDSKIVKIKENRQSVNFTTLSLHGMLTLDGDLWLA